MDAGSQILDSVVSIAIFLAAIPALWISGRIVLRNTLKEDHITRLFLWLALGGFFLIPLVDLISYLGNIISLAIQSDQNVTQFPLFLGTTSWPLYSAIAIAIGIAVYSFAIYYGRKVIVNRLRIMKELTLSSLEQSFFVLGLAGLFTYMIKGIVINFIWIKIPVLTSISSQSFIGSFVSWIIAFLILTIVVIFMDGQLKTEEE